MPDNSADFLILNAPALSKLLTPELCRDAIENAYRSLFAARDDGPQSLAFKTARGKLHVKASTLPSSGKYFAAKINANFPDNPDSYGLPTVQGVLALFSTESGRPLALMQSGALTGIRTAATAALAAKYGARPGASRLALIGAGAQSRFQIAALADLFPLREIRIYDVHQSRADSLAEWAATNCAISAKSAVDVSEALADCDIAVTITPSQSPFVRTEMLPRGAFVAAMGADNPDKNEIASEVFADARVFADDPDQCAKEGDLAHAIRAGAARREDVPGLADIASGAGRARATDADIVLFDSIGSGLQDVAAAAAAYEAALAQGGGVRVTLD